ncbi:peptidoglycan -binding protein [Pararhizobium mangrovi]|uniref:Peptidoglycan-binding protein n=1 Tax=Pararhizobium mangrovi TaxID=2590452 RepID=A0A506U3I1_9HYPH|nr:peptidoglycan -binding protein [Pararhizobium mangrovi]TPW27594.1 peptidoglycan -binding protein [Pararhizobium mangrovi]
MALSRSRRHRSMDFWPGFVDALSTLLLTIMFLLTVFVLGQFLLSREISGKDVVLNQLHSQINELTRLLALERSNDQDTEDQINDLRASLEQAQQDKSRLRQLLDQGSGASASAKARITDLKGSLSDQQQVSQRALSQVDLLNQQISALRSQISALEDALDVSEKKQDASKAKIADLGKRLNVALARRVQELNRYRSDFFGRLREILADRQNIRVVGDRFVFQSEVLFGSGASDISDRGKTELAKLADVLKKITGEIPSDINWILEVDGFTDDVPVSASSQYANNWELSTARATAVVEYLISQGVQPNRLAAAGFGEYQPIAEGDTKEARAQNRRIEIKLTDR